MAARSFAEHAHASQYRKGGDHVPYFTHLESVVQRLWAHGHSEEAELAVGYLHDVLEDQPVHGDALRAAFPPLIVEAVELLTEQKLDAHGKKRPKSERFRDYVQGLVAHAGPAARLALVVSCADKLDNMLSLVQSERDGDPMLTRLNTRPGQHRIQYQTLRGLFVPVVTPALLEAYDAASAELFDTVARWLPGRAVHIAAEVHLGRFDAAGRPYVYRTLAAIQALTTLEEKTVAALAEVTGDSRWPLSALEDEGFGADLLEAVACLSPRPGETDGEWAKRMAQSPLAIRVRAALLSLVA
jgi:(p)ppGpp synthase/HD superfamily hydrolase